MWSLDPVELASNMREQVSGLCGNYNGDLSDDIGLLNNNDQNTVLLLEENLFYGWGLGGAEPTMSMTYHAKEVCESEQSNPNFLEGMIYKRDVLDNAFLDTLDYSSVNLSKRDQLTESQARSVCEKAVSTNSQLLIIAELVKETPYLESFVEELELLVSAAIDGCAYDVQALGEELVGGKYPAPNLQKSMF
jgi:hypothetical protein